MWSASSSNQCSIRPIFAVGPGSGGGLPVAAHARTRVRGEAAAEPLGRVLAVGFLVSLDERGGAVDLDDARRAVEQQCEGRRTPAGVTRRVVAAAPFVLAIALGHHAGHIDAVVGIAPDPGRYPLRRRPDVSGHQLSGIEGDLVGHLGLPGERVLDVVVLRRELLGPRRLFEHLVVVAVPERSRVIGTFELVDVGAGDLTIHREYSDNGAGTVRVGGLDPVNYTNVEHVDILPIDPVSGATGEDGNGRVLVVDTDPFEHNNDRLNPTDLVELAAAPVNPNIDPAGVVDPFGFGADLPGDEDWYEFHATKTGTYEFEIEFDVIGDLANGRDGLPDDGQLVISAYDAAGDLISDSVVSADGQAVTIGVENGSTSYLRVDGLTEDVFNVYDIHITEVDLDGPRVFDPDGDGDDRHAVEITDDPAFDLFDVKPTAGPTPGVESITINIEDNPGRFPGFLYEALNSDVSSNPGHYHLVGDNNGIIAINDVIITNAPVLEGEVPTATIELVFDEPIPDDRYTLTLSESIQDPADNQLDGETNADEPNEDPAFPSGDGVAGGDFVARFTVDSRPEIATIGAGPRKGSGLQTGIYVDTNGNFDFDPKSGDHTNRDLVFEFGTEDDLHFAGQFSPEGATSVDGFDRLGAYGHVTEVIGQHGKRLKTQEVYRWLLDFDNDGVADYSKVAELQIQGKPVAGDFDPTTAGDEVGLYTGKGWYLDSNHSNDIEKGDIYLQTNLRGIPLVGDFDGDGKDDLATFLDQKNGKQGRISQFQFDLTSADDGTPGVLDGIADDTIDFKLAGQSHEVVPFSADFNIDGIDDIGLKEVNRRGVTPSDEAEWYFLMSNRADAAPGTADALDHAFSPDPLGNDMFAQFGHNDSLPLVGNFDPPVSSKGNTADEAPLTNGDDDNASGLDALMGGIG